MKLISASDASDFANYKNNRPHYCSNMDRLARDIVIESMDGSLGYDSHAMDLANCVECSRILVNEGYRVGVRAVPDSDGLHYLEIHWGL